MKKNTEHISYIQAQTAPRTHTTKFMKGESICMTKQDFEETLKIKQQISELKMAEEAGISIDKKCLKSMEKQLAGAKNRFNGMAQGMEYEVANILELHYLCGWPYRMIQKYIYGCNFCESHPRKIVERYFASNG